MKDRHKNPDLRRQVQMPGSEIEVVENSLRELIHPEDFQPIRNSLKIPEKLRRDRLILRGSINALDGEGRIFVNYSAQQFTQVAFSDTQLALGRIWLL
jgi:hypothetical protein